MLSLFVISSCTPTDNSSFSNTSSSESGKSEYSSTSSTSSFSSSSSSKEEIVKHQIHLNLPEGVSALLTVDGNNVTEAKKGDKVDIELTIDENHTFESILSSEVELTEVNKGHTYTFTMVDKEVNIEVKVTKVIKKYSIKSINIFGTSSSVNGINEGDEILEGNKVSFTISNYMSNYIYSCYFLDQKIEAVHENNIDTITFTMPSEDIDLVISPSYVKSETGTLFTLNANDALYSVYGIENNARYDSNVAGTLKLFILPKKGVRINSVSTSKDGGSFSKLYGGNQTGYSIYSYSSANTFQIKIDAEEVGVYSISFKDNENVTIDTQRSTINDVLPGDDVTIYYTVKDGFKLTNVTSSVTLNDLDFDQTSLTFTMPSSNLELDFATTSAFKLTYQENENLESVTFKIGTSSVTSAFPNDIVKIYPIAKQGKEVSTVYYAEGKKCEYSSYGYDNYYYFTMPSDGNVNISFEFVDVYTVSYDKSEAYSVYGLEDTYHEGDKVSFSIDANVGYKITKVSISNKELILDENGEYTFTMDKENVKLVIETSKEETFTLTWEKPDSTSYLSVSANGSSYQSGEKLVEGTKIKVSIYSLKEGYVFKGITLSNGTVIEANTSNYSPYCEFVMPKSNLVMTFNVEQKQSFAINVANNDKISSYDFYVDDSLTTSSKYLEGSKIKIDFTLKDETNYTISNVEVKTKDGTKIKSEFSSPATGPKVEFTMPNQDVNVTVTVVEKASYKLTLGTNSELFTVKDYSSSTTIYKNEDMIKEGVTITFAVNSNVDGSKYYFQIVNSEDNKVITNNISADNNDEYEVYSRMYTFKDKNITINLIAK